ncbi:ABC transporter ATP-binding protein [Candidatus Entotheonella palauensis]|uniref:ABC transporter ATP-binding protein n=1 Tax=Candidatus Entotheonella palauensis TaxID=93172 RepID=UPI0015C478E1|nr:oligopeptide/dipeptide ABC transporter ATP-binding protein [Candidatus Entotheonella palauensis]
MENETLVTVNNLVKYFPVTRGLILERKIADVKAVDGVSFSIKQGDTLGLVGESGSGKTTVGKCVLQIYPPTSGEVFYQNQDLVQLDRGELRQMRRHMQPIYQDPYSSLDPRMTVADLIGEPMVVHGIAQGKEIRERVNELLQLVGLAPYMAERYPHMFSGGQRQRIGIARALACQPSFLVCDEPVSALDVSIQAQIVNLLMDLQEKFNLTYLFIAHDLAVVKYISQQVAVMYLGKIMEVSTSEDLYGEPLHPYTRALLSAVPIPDPEVEHARERHVLTGEIPSPLAPPSGCSFHPRCPDRLPICSEETPLLIDQGGGHCVACHLYT